MPAGRVSTGVPRLDDILGKLYWGDNVVWQLDGVASADWFYRRILRRERAFDMTAWVAVGSESSPLMADHAQLAIVGTTPGSAPVEPSRLLRQIRRQCEPGRRSLLLFDSLDVMVRTWGVELTRGFFARCCPLLLEVGAVAYWSMDLRRTPASLQTTVAAVTQCVLRLDRHSIFVAKAEGREHSVKGSLLHWNGDEKEPVLREPEVTDRVAASLRALRQSRKIAQQQLARLAGVSASAISQAERAERGLSLTTLVRLSSRLGLTLDELLETDEPSTYRIGRRAGDPRSDPERAITLLGGLTSDVSVDLVHLGAREAGAPVECVDGAGIVAVARGLVQVGVDDKTPAIRDGEVLLADCARVSGWRNLGDREAVLFWIVVARERESPARGPAGRRRAQGRPAL